MQGSRRDVAGIETCVFIWRKPSLRSRCMRQARPVKHPHALGGPLPVIAVMEALLDMDTTRDVLKEAIDDIVREERHGRRRTCYALPKGLRISPRPAERPWIWPETMPGTKPSTTKRRDFRAAGATGRQRPERWLHNAGGSADRSHRRAGTRPRRIGRTRSAIDSCPSSESAM